MALESSPSENLNQRISDHLASRFRDDNEVLAYSQQFRREGYLKIPDLIPEDVKADVFEEVYGLLQYKKRIDIHLEATGGTPRKMSTVSQQMIRKEGHLIPEVYASGALMGFLGRLAHEPVVPCPWEDEEYVIIKQERSGDTHGWHWGDFPFTLIWIVEAPELDVGGILQCVPHTDWNKSNPRVYEYLLANPIRSYGHKSGDIYFLRSDTTLHRTIPLTEDRTRIILNTCWGGLADINKEKTHETMDAMF